MNKRTKRWLIAALFPVLAGCIVLGVVMSIVKGDYMKLAVNEYETQYFEIKDEYRNIQIVSKFADVKMIFSDANQSTEIACCEQKKIQYSVSVKDGMLVIETVDTRKWYDHIGINGFHVPYITVSVPKENFESISITTNTGNVEIPEEIHFESISVSANTGNITCKASAEDFIKLKTTTGNIAVKELSATSLALSASTGKIMASDITCENEFSVSISTGKTVLNNISCKKLESVGNTGSIFMKNIIAAESLSVMRNTGDIEFNRCDAAEFFAKTTTGNIEGTLLSEKTFITKTTSGAVHVPRGTSGGRCELETNSGDIEIEIVN